MASERKWLAVAPQLLTSDGTSEGRIYIKSARGFRSKQRVVLVDPSKPTDQQQFQFQIKRVTSKMLILGPNGPTPPGMDFLSYTSDLTAFTLANGCYVFAEEQDKSKVPKIDQDSASYEQEPVVARRVFSVDEFGNSYNSDNPVPTIQGGRQITPPEFDDVVIVRDAEDYPTKYRFLLRDEFAGAIDVTYNANRSSVRYKRNDNDE